MLEQRSHFLMKFFLSFFFLFFVVVLFAGEGRAQRFDAKWFAPLANPYGLLNVDASRPLSQMEIYAQLSTNYAKNLLILVNRNEELLGRPIAYRITSELSAGIGLFDRFSLAFSLPIFLSQAQIDYPQLRASQTHSGVGDLRLLAKGMLLKNKQFHGIGAAIALEVGIPLATDSTFMNGASASFMPRLIIDYKHSKGWLITFNLAYKWQKETTFSSLVIGDELHLALGTEIPFSYKGLSIAAEWNLNFNMAPSSQSGEMSIILPSEFILAFRWRHPSGFIASLGTGLGSMAQYGAPDVRFFLSFGFTTKGFEKYPPPKTTIVEKVVFIPKVVYVEKDVQKVKKSQSSSARSVANVSSSRSASLSSPSASLSLSKKSSPKISVALLEKAARQDPDRDGDGIANDQDRCPDKSEDFDGFQDQDGCPDEDNDKDGIPDKLDKCPLQKETINGIKDDDGCPDKGKGKILLTKGKIKINDKIYFNSGSDQLKKRSYAILRQIAAFIKANWQLRLVRIEGHTDDRGNPEMNVDLSERRAQRVRAFLMKLGIAGTRLIAKGYGSTRPISTNKTARGRAKNRRVEFTVLKVYIPKVRKGSQ